MLGFVSVLRGLLYTNLLVSEMLSLKGNIGKVGQTNQMKVLVDFLFYFIKTSSGNP